MIIALQTLIFFRESLLSAISRLLQPYYKTLLLTLSGEVEDSDDDDSDDAVFSEFDEEKGVVFFPPMYVQRYAAVTDCLMDERWCGRLEKVVDFGYHDMSFIKYLKEVPGVRTIIGVDIETLPLRCASDLLGCDEYTPKRESPLQVTLFQGNAADPDYRLIGCDAVASIEMIEHMLPHDLERFVHTVFGFVRPWIAIFTTPNADFNVLFKAMERNGLRRWDHLFEWSREQFNDWCSNIVARYPEYTVICQGIGPGPPGTEQYGCCSQLALFISKDYHKQQDLDLNSLAVVANAPVPDKINDMMDGWDVNSSTILHNTEPVVEPSLSTISYNGIKDMDKESVTVVLSALTHSFPSSTTCPIETVTLTDKVIQCNLESEISKSFLMFDDNPYLEVLVPRRTTNHKVYEIEDVCSRLNCSTFKVDKFSKTTRNLMARNKMDSLLHTRQVVNEIRQLTNILNFNRDSQPVNGNHIWCNINWGENAPYWNQYYKIVRDYNCPFETKSEECRILELVSDEINHLIDTQCDDEFAVDVNRIEIPLSDLMAVVAHITDDVDRVRDILEWNGYEIVGDILIHTRLVVEGASVATHEDDWQETETLSDWDTDLRSTSLSDGSTMIPDYHGRCLRRALDIKLRNLRTMLTADEDITTELDKVVCRLMKLALRTSNGRQSSPPARWMQCKLLDLLTLTEKAIERRKKHFIESYRFSEVQLPSGVTSPLLERIRNDDTAKEIMYKYDQLIPTADGTNNEDLGKLNLIELDIEGDYMSALNEYTKDYDEHINKATPSLADLMTTVSPRREENLERTQAWLDVDVTLATYPKTEVTYDDISSGDTDHGVPRMKHKQKKANKKRKPITDKAIKEIEVSTHKGQTSQSKRDEKGNKKKGGIGVTKKVAWKKSSHSSLTKKKTSSYLMRRSTQSNNVVTSIMQRSQEQLYINMKATKPASIPSKLVSLIPESLINLCQSDFKDERGVEEYTPLNNVDIVDDIATLSDLTSNISATEESNFINIITMDNEETIALLRTIGTSAETESDVLESILNDSICNDVDINLCAKHQVSTENMQSQTIFLNDINEPSTSKGIRRNVSMDVQCGPDSFAGYSLQAPSPSLAKIPEIYSMGIKINDAATDTTSKGIELVDPTQENNSLTLESRTKSAGIKIKDSDVAIDVRASTTQTTSTNTLAGTKDTPVDNEVTSHFETKLLKNLSSISKIEDCCSKTSTHFANLSKNPSEGMVEFVSPPPSLSIPPSDILMESASKAGGMTAETCNNFVRPNLRCGGVHVHSFKDKCLSEDIVFQGEWQRYRPKANSRKKTISTIVFKKTNESILKKKKEFLKDKQQIIIHKKILTNENKSEVKKLQLRNAKMNKTKLGIVNFTQPKKPVLCNKEKELLNKIPKPISRFNKAAMKIPTGSITSKPTKTSYTVKKSPIPVYSAPYTKTDCEKSPKTEKSHIPVYIKQNVSSRKEKNNLNKSIDSANVEKRTVNIKEKSRILRRTKTEEINKDLLSFSDDLRQRLSYVVFRNELEEKRNSSDKIEAGNVATNKNQDNSNMQLSRPQSVNSSTCSSPSSVATVRIASNRSRNETNRRHSASSPKSNYISSESDNPTPVKIKRVIRKCKSAKKSDNKENVPQTTKNVAGGKDTDKMCKSPFVGRQKNVFVVQMKPDSSQQLLPTNTSPKQKLQTPNKTSSKNSPHRQTTEKKTSSPTVSKKKLLKSKSSLLLEPQDRDLSLEINTKLQNLSKSSPTKINKVTEWLKHSSSNTNAYLLATMKELVEDTLDFIDSPYDALDSATVVLSRKNSKYAKTGECELEENKKAPLVYANPANCMENNKFDDQSKLESDFDNESIASFTANKTVEDSDLLSFKSLTSISKYSEYFLADNEPMAGQSAEQGPAKNTNSSVQDLFERKDANLAQKTTGIIAVPFSGFSFSELMATDQPDSIALIDSETGSGAVDMIRQATSEELFVSGRSSGSYQSCVIDDDAVVPTWLFDIINHHQTDDDDSEPVVFGPRMEQLGAPLYDENGNTIEPAIVGVGAGAGDGCGIHSDHSQDSSGQGTSLSSSETSSGPQSQAILIDPSAFTAQFDLLREPLVGGQQLPSNIYENASSESTFRMVQEERVPITLRQLPPNGASDVDADISSLDTDVPDSSDN